jgi:hypothetical protein
MAWAKDVLPKLLYQRPRRLTHVGDSLAPDFLTPWRGRIRVMPSAVRLREEPDTVLRGGLLHSDGAQIIVALRPRDARPRAGGTDIAVGVLLKRKRSSGPTAFGG